MPYNPFGPPIGNTLAACDLEVLVQAQVAEGHFIEFKRQLPSTTKIGRSIASFSNTEGGWYVVGVETNDHHQACAVRGFQDPSDVTAKIREIVKTHIDPSPVVHPQVVALGSDRIVLVLWIPTGEDPPYVTRDGKIYRRTGDSSHPIPETRRHAIDRLIDRGSKNRKRFAEFCQDERAFSEAEENQAWLQLFIAPDPLTGLLFKEFNSENAIDSLLARSRRPTKLALSRGTTFLTGNVPFNSGWPTGDTVVLRQVNAGNEAFNSLELELFADGRCRILIPITGVHSGAPGLGDFQSAKAAALLRSAHCEHQDRLLLRFVDLGELWLAAACLLTYYVDWIEEHGTPNALRVVIRASNVWRTVGFLDSDLWADAIAERGIPTIRTGNVVLPRNVHRGALINLERGSMPWISVSCWIGQLFGIPREKFVEVLPTALQRTLTSRQPKNDDQK